TAQHLVGETDGRAGGVHAEAIVQIPEDRDIGALGEDGLAGGVQHSPGRVRGSECETAARKRQQVQNGILRAGEILEGPAARLGPTANRLVARYQIPEAPGRVESGAVRRPGDAAQSEVGAGNIRNIKAVEIRRVENVHARDVL